MNTTQMRAGILSGFGSATHRWVGVPPFVVAALGVLLFVGGVKMAPAQSLTLERQIELPLVRGRIDHMAVDADGQRLFVAALGSDSLEVIDLNAGRRVERITSLHEPQGVLYLGRRKRLFVANSSGGGVQAFADGKAPAVASTAPLADADNLRFDSTSDVVYVGFGKSLAALDPDTLQIRRRIDLAGHPESFQIEQSGRKIYVNVPSAGHVAVVDRGSGKVEATWTLTGAARNFPMALDERDHRLFIVTRLPARLFAYQVRSGRRIAQVSVCGDADEVFLDDSRRQLYVVCGEGQIDVVRGDGEQYVVAERVPTAPGARTGLFVPSLSTLFVAVPARGGSTAEIRAYKIQ